MDRAPKPLIDNFDFALFGQTNDPNVPKFRGYISSIDPTTAGAGVLIGGSQNTHKTLLGTIKVRDGLKLRGTEDTESAGVVASFEWYTSRGTVLPLRVIVDNGTGLATLQVESDIADGSTLVWYDLLVDLDDSRFVFDTWWNDAIKQDVLIAVNGDGNIYAWSGAMGVLASTTAVTIVLTETLASQGFALAASTVVINGNEYAYTSQAGSTFSGVSPTPVGEANGSIVIEKVETTLNTPTGFSNDFIKVVNNQLHVGAYNSRLIYISAFDDFHDFTVPAVRVTGDPDLLTLDSQARGITVQKGATDVSGNAVISGGLGDWYTVIRSQLTVGTDLTEQVQIIRSTTADLSTALAHEFITLVGVDIIFVDQNNQLRQFGLVRNIVSPVFPLLSLDVFTELKNRDFTGGAIRAVADENDTTIYITVPAEGIDYMYHIRQKIDEVGNKVGERFWDPPQVRNVSRIAVIDGITYGHSNANPQIYQLWNTGQYSDDSPSGEELPYECHATFAYLSLPDRTDTLYFDKLYYEGYMTQGTTLYNNIYYEYQGSQSILTVRVNKPTDPGKKMAKFYSSTATPSLGDVSLGEIPLGEGISAVGGSNPPKFRAMRRVQPQEVFEFALDLASYDLDSQWEILCLGANMQPTPSRATSIMG